MYCMRYDNVYKKYSLYIVLKNFIFASEKCILKMEIHNQKW